jgi:FdhD protein
MALKCSSAGIPLLASRGATTSLAITLAEKTGLTLVSFVRGKKMNIYTNSWRVIGSDLGPQVVSQLV